MSRAASEMQSGLIAYLQGYGRNNRAGLSAIAAYGAWPVLAAPVSYTHLTLPTIYSV